jgi:ankyrin repeat protein
MKEKLFLSIKEGNLDALKSLLTQENKNSIDHNGNTLLMYAVLHEQDTIIHFLLEQKVDINKNNFYGSNALIMSLYKNIEVTQKLLALNANKECINQSVLPMEYQQLFKSY